MASCRANSQVVVFVMSACLSCSGAIEFRHHCRNGRPLIKTDDGQADYLKCPPGTFMPLYWHSQTKCFQCTEMVDPQLEIFLSPCNPHQDTHIQCIHGYFRQVPYPPVGGKCQKCTDCQFYKRRCSDRMDSVCCSRKEPFIFNDKATDRESECVSLCGRNQYLNLTTLSCLDCPAGTFMPRESHTNNNCWNCIVPKSPHEIVIQPCSSTQPGVIGCVDGYYRVSPEVSTSQHCAKCQVCSENAGSSGLVYEGRPCGLAQNTVCCGHPGMIVADTAEGAQCESPAGPKKEAGETPCSKRCGRDEHLTLGADGLSVLCFPCPVGTCMAETDHSHNSCHPCHVLDDSINSGQTGTSGYMEILVLVIILHLLDYVV